MAQQNPVADLRNQQARQAVLRIEAEKYDYHAEVEQILVQHGFYDYAQLAHENAARVLRAWQRDIDDPKPEGLA
jgi:hypothetical protein